MVHAQPQSPPTRRPVTSLNPCSNAAPTPMEGKKPPTARNSVPCPRPHIPRSCITRDTAAKAPRSAPPGRELKAT
ncbi:hypothetical protein BGY98DRAFT_426948 [Russula aff. rugulosa BPL654]|nr:hypothetical protein BGY98DRAFT_426948 [Russula aff. rugulosa BPL654]